MSGQTVSSPGAPPESGRGPRRHPAAVARARVMALPVPPTVPPALLRTRHWVILAAFALTVVLPSVLAGWYLAVRAVDRYVSTVAFSVRSEIRDAGSDLGSAAYRDLDVVYAYLQSAELVAIIDERLDLRGHFSAPHARDPLFSLVPDATIEDLAGHWRRLLRVAYEPSRGMIALRVEAFTPDMAPAIAAAVLEEATRVINEMSAVARDQAMRYALEDLDRAESRLRSARADFTAFRSGMRMVDPDADLTGLNALIAAFQAQLAVALVELDLLRETTRPEDPRIATSEREIAAIRARIEDERQRFSSGGEARGGGLTDYVTLYGEYERLRLEREFAELSHQLARGAHAAALANAQLQSRYVIAHVRPTRAERAELPDRLSLWFFLTLSCLIMWCVSVLIYYGIRDAA